MTYQIEKKKSGSYSISSKNGNESKNLLFHNLDEEQVKTLFYESLKELESSNKDYKVDDIISLMRIKTEEDLFDNLDIEDDDLKTKVFQIMNEIENGNLGGDRDLYKIIFGKLLNDILSSDKAEEGIDLIQEDLEEFFNSGFKEYYDFANSKLIEIKE